MPKYSSGRGDAMYGQGFNALFTGDGPVTSAPFMAAGRLKTEPLFNADAVKQTLSMPNPPTADFDPGDLRSTQPMVTRGGVKHYMDNPDSLFSDQNNAGNQMPVVYSKLDGQHIILSGHHRATAALLQGKPLTAIHVQDPRLNQQPLQATAFFVRTTNKNL